MGGREDRSEGALRQAQDRPFDPSTEFILSKVEGLRTGIAQDRPFDTAQDRPFDTAQDRPFDTAQDRPFAWCDCWPWV